MKKKNSHNSLGESSFSRTQLIFGKEAMEKLASSSVFFGKTKVVGSTAFVPPENSEIYIDKETCEESIQKKFVHKNLFIVSALTGANLTWCFFSQPLGLL